MAAALGPLGVVFRALLVRVFYSMGRLSFVHSGVGAFDGSRLPTLADIRRMEAGFELRVKRGKAQQDAADFFWVPLLPCGGSPACPVVAFEALPWALNGFSREAPLLSLPQAAVPGQHLRRFLNLRLACQWLAWLLRDLGRDSEGYTFKSLRRGACTLVSDRGAAVTDIMRLG